MEADSTQSTDRYLKAMEWLHANRKKLIIAGGIVVVIGVIVAVMAWQKSGAEADANAQLMATPLVAFQDGKPGPPPADPFLKLARDNPDTGAGEYAALLGAEALFESGKYPEAHQEFSKFIDQYPSSALLAQAKLGVAASLEGENKIQEAAQKYQELISGYPTDASIASPAKLTLARLYEELNKPSQALTYYSELARNANQNDLWALEARERGELLLARHPELRKAPPGSETIPGALPGQRQSPSAPLKFLPPPSESNRLPAPPASAAPTKP